MTAPISPRSSETRTSDFSGTKPRTAGRAAISDAGTGEAEVEARCVVMTETLSIHTVRTGPAPAGRAWLWMKSGLGYRHCSRRC